MKKIIAAALVSMAFLMAAEAADAQMPAPDDHTAREKAAGKAIRDKLQEKQATCSDLSDEDFGALGEYFMGQMMGNSHAAMNAMMIQMHGEEGEEQIHIVMGKRLSGCDTSAVVPGISGGWMPMMNMMWGGWPASPDEWASRGGSSLFDNNSTNNMMNFGYGFGFFGWTFMILWWVLIIAGIVALVRWIAGQSRGGVSGKPALDILKERYAKGEINKQEFEDKKKDLT